MIQEVSKKTKDKVKEIAWGLIIVLVVCLFTYSAVKIFTERSQIAHEEALNKINIDAERRESMAKMQRDLALEQNIKSYEKVSNLEKEVKEQKVILNKFQASYDKNSKELNKFKNEKSYIPDNVGLDEQSTYISDFIYKPY